MDYLEYKGYKGSVEYSKADNCLCGKVLGMSKDLILYEGNTIDELRADFEAGVESYLAGCLADGVEPRKPYSGTLNIRISPEIHSRIAALAQEAGTTINGYIKQALPIKNKGIDRFRRDSTWFHAFFTPYFTGHEEEYSN